LRYEIQGIEFRRKARNFILIRRIGDRWNLS